MQILAIKKILEIWNLEGYFKIKNGEKLKVKKMKERTRDSRQSGRGEDKSLFY